MTRYYLHEDGHSVELPNGDVYRFYLTSCGWECEVFVMPPLFHDVSNNLKDVFELSSFR
jgi:hypothetical protein